MGLTGEEVASGMVCGFLSSAFEENSDFFMFLACFPAQPPRKGSVTWCHPFPGWSCAHTCLSLLGTLPEILNIQQKPIPAPKTLEPKSMGSSEREGETSTERTVIYPRSPNEPVAKDGPTPTKIPHSTKIFSCNAKNPLSYI